MPDSTKSAVVTSALPYANGEIHLGHIASTYLPADIFTRFSRLNGVKAYHICATDDFGTPILIRAEKEKKSPEEYVALWNRRDYEDFSSLGISFDFFYKTSSKENVEFVQYVFKKLQKNGHIYDQNVIQFYCTFDDKFLPDRYVIGKCPYCGAENQYSDLCEKCGRVPDQILEPKCAICGRPPVKKESKHYFFRLSSFGEKLKEWLSANQNLQPEVRNYVINWINEGLQDWDITRDLSWGVPIPGAEGKVFYGWFDNHLCYISSLVKFISDKKGGDGKKFWNESDIYHFIGKDIVYHHYLFLPAMRLGIDSEYKLPDYIPTRGHLMLQNQKISKSRNWYIGLRDFTSAFNPDYLRFYIASVVTYSQDDLNFDFDAFYERINNELIANVGNFVNRALSFTQKSFGGKVPEPANIDDSLGKELAAAVDEAGSLLAGNEIDKALKRVLKYSSFMNQYFQANTPWANKDTANTTLYVSVNAVRSLAILLEPFIPFSCEKIWSQLKMGGGSVHEQAWESAKDLRAVAPGHELGKVEPIFRKIEAKEIEQWKNKLGKP
ncbi:methionine--tRNA ligase [Candidatus Nitrososphaera gargensis Ga9.2]|uniref:Methionine--tRNA ligase n=1 Tax=Nitrososphaera gargensis (strain Ga9.2) TaxID=1237085 RepID=K0IJE3_NITGG|nr:methionine--tRNA ligase [Candidatus Nitrososphaera gargensis]AFU60145.1 methionine--tRNA ligase [Candidatus Nitrososphaera gargensis Ga9.2]